MESYKAYGTNLLDFRELYRPKKQRLQKHFQRQLGILSKNFL